MGFKSLISQQVSNAFDILGTGPDGLARARTYVSVGDPVYDPVTRTSTSPEQRIPNVPMALVRFKIEDMDDTVKPATDRVALIAALRLPVVPDENDKIEDVDGSIYTVKKLMSDPADALYKLHVCKSEGA